MNGLTSLTVKDYAGIRAIDVIPSQVTVITGKNGSGKSAIRDAIHHLFTGEVARDVKVAQLVRQGGKTMEIVGTLEGGKKIHRKRVKSGTETRMIDGQQLSSEAFTDAIAHIVGTPMRTIGAAILTGHIFDLKLPELLRVMQDITGVEFDEDYIREKLGEGIVAAAREVSIRTPECLDDFARAEKEAIEVRKSGKRLRDAREEDLNRLAVPAGVAADKANALVTKNNGNVQAAINFAKGKLEEYRSERDALLRKMASAAGRREGQLEALEKRINELRGTKDALETEVNLEILEKSRSELAQLQKQLRALTADRASIVAEGKAVKARLDELVRERDALPDGEEKYHPSDLPEIEARIKVLQGHVERDSEALAAAEEALANGGTSLPVLSQTHKGLSPCPAFPNFKCPVSTATFDELRKQSKLGTKDLEKRIEEARENFQASKEAVAGLQKKYGLASASVRRQQLLCEIEKIEPRLAELRKQAEERKSEETQLSADVDKLQALVNAAAVKAKQLESVREEGKRLVAERKALREQPATDEATPEQIAEHDTRIQRAEATIEVMALLKRREEAMAAFKAADRQATAADMLVGAFGAKGIKLKLINEATDPVVSVVNRSLSRLAPDYTVDIDVEGETPIRVTKGKSTVVSPKALSRGEYLRVGYVFQYAIASMTGQKVIVFDDVDAIDTQGAVALASIVNAMCEEGVQIFLMTHGAIPPGLTAQARVYRLENGEIVETTGVTEANVALSAPGVDNMPSSQVSGTEVDPDDPF